MARTPWKIAPWNIWNVPNESAMYGAREVKTTPLALGVF
jgi:hypothetical protein